MAHFTPLLALFLALLAQTLAQNATVTTITTTTTATPTLTRVVDLFFLNERAYEGLPYTLFHRDSGSVVAVDSVNSLTTYVITTTRGDRRGPPGAKHTDDATTAIPTLKPTHSRHWHPANGTGPPSTITQGPATFMFTGTRYGPDLTVVNHCSLNGTANAACNLTHVGAAWYTPRDPAWNGSFSTYSYTGTSGDRLGFAPVTITAGAALLTGDLRATPSGGGTSGAIRSRAVMGGFQLYGGAVGVGWWVVVGGVVVVLGVGM
ncbi:hypothetical protein C8A01DRAFT_12537 [Parachaetomium inaequale]|uniref:Uncharacterized protein n=1 Tax=Parachaetomium inaequale TaxID=2588326 RepID=A0AAN6PMX9_9PEZI|nr:hypothetical protein C8A01DRAFT_12537 [Parachaetomium inaequale]